jgi:hypothetical protein
MLHMLSVIGTNKKVCLAVILFVVVYVVNLFAFTERSPNHGLGNNNVLEDIPLGVRSWVGL